MAIENVLGSVLFSGDLPPANAVLGAMAHAFPGVSLDDEGLVSGEANGVFVAATMIPAAPSAEAAAQNAHPLFCRRRDGLAQARSEILLLARPGFDAQENDPQALLRAHSKVVAMLLTLPDVVGYHFASVATTFDTRTFAGVLGSGAELPVPLWAPVWAWPEENGRVSAYTYGLHNLDLPELELVQVALGNPLDAVGYLTGAAETLLRVGSAPEPGQSIPTQAGDLRVVSRGPWSVEEDVTALRLDLG